MGDRLNLYEQQARNRRRTWAIMAAFVVFLFLLGLGFDTFYLGTSRGGFPIGSIVALGVGSMSALVSYVGGDRAVLLATGAKPLVDVVEAASDADKLKLRQLEHVVEEMNIA